MANYLISKQYPLEVQKFQLLHTVLAVRRYENEISGNKMQLSLSKLFLLERTFYNKNL